jgi:hypothetical protein
VRVGHLQRRMTVVFALLAGAQLQHEPATKLLSAWWLVRHQEWTETVTTQHMLVLVMVLQTGR